MAQCWAFNRDGVRCELDAGHATLHSLAITWDDDECFSPIAHQLPPNETIIVTSQPAPPVTDVSLPPVLPPPMEAPKGCVGCGHRHKDGPCKCGCYEYIG